MGETPTWMRCLVWGNFCAGVGGWGCLKVIMGIWVMATYREQIRGQLLKRKDELYKALVSQFEEMFDRDHIRHFTVRSEGVCDLVPSRDLEKYTKDTEKDLIKWIYNEHNNGELFIKENWKSYIDRDTITDIFIVYKKLFQFENYYFGLLFDDECNKSDCPECVDYFGYYNFQLLLYGWKEKDGTFHGNKKFVNIESNTISDYYWNII
jgi:hypothetical protein